jgi:hypothetical protein
MLLDLRIVVLIFKECKVRSLLPCSSFSAFLAFHSFGFSETFAPIILRIREHNKIQQQKAAEHNPL